LKAKPSKDKDAVKAVSKFTEAEDSLFGQNKIIYEYKRGVTEVGDPGIHPDIQINLTMWY